MVISIAFNLDGGILTSGGSDGPVHLWDTATGSKIRSFTAHTGAITVAFSPDGNSLATGDEIRALTAHTGPVIGIAFSPHDNTLASIGLDGTLLLWDLPLLHQHNLPKMQQGWCS